jgi:hypothetical protein
MTNQNLLKENPEVSLSGAASCLPLSNRPSMKAVFENPENFQPTAFFDAIENPTTRRILVELFSSLGLIPMCAGDERPEWAKQAWREFWRSSALVPGIEDTTPDAGQNGYTIGLLSHFNPDDAALTCSPDISQLLKFVSELIPEFRQKAAQSAPEEAAAFFDAQKKGHERGEQLSQISQRAKIFMVIAVQWQVVAEYNGTKELFKWLESLGTKEKPFLAPTTDSREIRTICKIIGLNYNSRKGRPPK